MAPKDSASEPDQDDALAAAVDELYAGDLDQFTPRRNELAKRSRAAGDKEVAKAITALRKPTQAAFTINRLARTDPSAIDELITVGGELRRAQRSTDAESLRELNKTRRALLNSLVRRAFEVIEQQSPTASQQDDISATFQAALADPDLAQQLQGGTLVKAAESSGFGFTPPELTLVRSSASRRAAVGDGLAAVMSTKDEESANAGVADTKAADTDAAVASAAAEKEAKATAREKAARQKADQRAVARQRAQSEVDAADAAVHTAVVAIDAGQQLIRMLQRQLTDARRELENAQKAAKDAETRQRKAREALNKLQSD